MKIFSCMAFRHEKVGYDEKMIKPQHHGLQ